MTSSKNTNDPRRENDETSPSSNFDNKNYDDMNLDDMDLDDTDFESEWNDFIEEYGDELDDVLRSRLAKHFKKHVEKDLKKKLELEAKRKEAAIKAQHLQDGEKVAKNKFSFKNLSSKESYISPKRMQDSHVQFVNPQGPRDNTRSSWLDVDETMDDYGDDFVPPNPTLENIPLTTAILWIVFALGIAGIIFCAFVPSLSTIIGIASGLFILIGGAGLIMNRKKPDPYKEDYRDYGHGARV